MPGMDDWKVASAFEEIEFDDNRIARRAFNSDLRSCARRAAWPAFAWFEAWLLVGRRTREVDFIWR